MYVLRISLEEQHIDKIISIVMRFLCKYVIEIYWIRKITVLLFLFLISWLESIKFLVNTR